jgi:hypothetical protein
VKTLTGTAVVAMIVILAGCGASSKQAAQQKAANELGAAPRAAATTATTFGVETNDPNCFGGVDLTTNDPCTPSKGAPRPPSLAQLQRAARHLPRPRPLPNLNLSAPAPKHPNYPATYPGIYEDAFAVQCRDEGGSYQSCTCALRHIEQAVAYATALAATHDIVTGDPPDWYTAAVAECQ